MQRLALVLAVLVAAYALAGFLVAPGLVRSSVLDAMGRTLVTRPTLGRVRVNPFALSVTLEDLRIREAGGAPAAGFDRLYVRFDPLRSLLSRAWTLAALRVDRPAIAVELLPDRSLSLMRLLRPQPAGADTMGSAPRYFIHRLRVRDGLLKYADLSRPHAFTKSARPIEFELTDFGTTHDSRNEYAFSARTDLGESVAWRGRFTLQPFRSEGELRFGDLRAVTLSDLMGDQAAFAISRGTFTLHAGYKLDAAKVPAELGLSAIGVEARDLALTDRLSGEEVLSAGTLTTRGGTLDLARAALSLGQVRADGARVLLWMAPDGHMSFERWAQATPGDTSKPITTTIPEAHVNGLALEFQDRRLTPGVRLRVRGGSIDLKNFSTAPGSSFQLAATCSLGTAGRASAAGKVTPSTPSADLELELHGFDLREIQPYVNAFARLDITSGSAEARGSLKFNAFGARGPLLRFKGDASSRDFLAVDRKVGLKFLAWKQLDLRGLEYDAMPGRMALHQVDAVRPYIRMIVAPDRTTNVQAMQTPPDSVPPAFRPVPGQPDTMPVRIDLVNVHEGSMYFADLSLTPNFATGIQSMNGSIRELSSAEAAHATIEIDGKVDAYAPARIAGTVNPLNGRGRTDLTMSFKNIELTTFSPYSGKFMGYQIEKGKLDLDLEYKIQDRQLDASNKVFVRQFTLGDKVASPDATKLPVRFAVALLKDRDGNINLNLPVKGNLDDPKFSVFPIVMKVLVGLVTKAVASPFALLGAAFGGGDEQSPAVTFAFGSAQLDTSDTKVLQAVRKGLADRPALKLEIEQPETSDADSLALLAREYDKVLRGTAAAGSATPTAAQRAAAGHLAPPGFGPEEWVSALTRAYTSRVGKPPALQGRFPRERAGAPPDTAAVAAEARRLSLMDGQLREHLLLNPIELGGLSRRRVNRVRDVILADSTIAPERVFVTNGRPVARRDSVGVKVGLTLTD